MIIRLPPAVQVFMPRQYVRYLNDANVASIERAPAIAEGSIAVSLTETHLLWQHAEECLQVKLSSLRMVSLCAGSHGPNRFVFVVLHFSDTEEEGVRVLCAAAENAASLEPIVSALKGVIPCDFRTTPGQLGDQRSV